VDSYDDAALLFRVQSFKFGSYQKKGNWLAVLDSGLSLIALPASIVGSMSRHLPVAWDESLQLWTIDCDEAKTQEDWVFGIGDNEIRLEASMYIIDVGFL
jgi:hypothetical protein